MFFLTTSYFLLPSVSANKLVLFVTNCGGIKFQISHPHHSLIKFNYFFKTFTAAVVDKSRLKVHFFQLKVLPQQRCVSIKHSSFFILLTEDESFICIIPLGNSAICRFDGGSEKMCNCFDRKVRIIIWWQRVKSAKQWN